MDTKNLTINVLLVLLTATISGGWIYLVKQQEISNLQNTISKNTEDITALKDELSQTRKNLVTNDEERTTRDSDESKDENTPQESNNNTEFNVKIPIKDSKDNIASNIQLASRVQDAKAIKALFANKYNKNVSDVILEITDDDGIHAKGNVKFSGDIAGGWWLAAKQNDQWILVADGNGVIMCDDIQPYNFPASMVPECYDSTSGQTITR